MEAGLVTPSLERFEQWLAGDPVTFPQEPGSSLKERRFGVIDTPGDTVVHCAPSSTYGMRQRRPSSTPAAHAERQRRSCAVPACPA